MRKTKYKQTNKAKVGTSPNVGMQLAIEKAGNQIKLAKLVGLRQSTISGYLNRKPPIELAIWLEKKFDIDRKLFRPDVFNV